MKYKARSPQFNLLRSLLLNLDDSEEIGDNWKRY